MLWTAEQIPPQVSEDAENTVLLQLLEGGVIATAMERLGRLQTEDEILAEYIDRLGFTLNNLSVDGIWPERALKIGAATAFFAYRESNYRQTVTDEAFDTGSTLALAQGIPEAYYASVPLDPKLSSLLEVVTESKELQDADGGYGQVLAIGAGCTRWYLQQTLLTAA